MIARVRRRALLAAVVTLVPLGWAAPGSAAAASSPPRSYYFSPRGSDSAAGTSATSPWRSLSRIATLPLHPGDRIRLQGGAVFTDRGGLTVAHGGTSGTPVVVESYGTGPAAVTGSTGSCVTLRADHVLVSGIVAAGCGYAGVQVEGDADQVQHLDAHGSQVGVAVDRSAAYTSVRSSRIHDNRTPAPGRNGPNDDSGAFGVLVSGSHTTISGNSISGHDVASPDYGRDGSAVEVFGGTDTVIADNQAADNQTFVEVGGIPGYAEAVGVSVRANQVTSALSGSLFAVVHAGDSFGTARGVALSGNDVHLRGPGTIGVAAGPRCTPTALGLSDNTIVVTRKAIAVSGTYRTRHDVVYP